MSKLLAHEPEGKCTVVIPNTHGDTPSSEIRTFCGDDIINELLKKLKEQPSGQLFFEKDGVFYRVYGGPSKAVTIPGKYCFHVYGYCLKQCQEGVGHRGDSLDCGNRKSKSKELSYKKHNTGQSVFPEYNIDWNKRCNFIDPLTGKKLAIIDDSFVESELPLVEEFNKQANANTRIHLDAMFELGVSGRIEDAILLVLSSNCGYDDADTDAFHDQRIREAFANIRKDKSQPHFALSSYTRAITRNDGAMYPMCQWWERHIGKKDGLLAMVKKLKGDISNEEAIDWLSRHFATREFYSYHSKFSDIASWLQICKQQGCELAPHQEVMVEEIRLAIEKHIPIFITRAVDKWIEFGKRYVREDFADYKLLFVGISRQNACITPGNISKTQSGDSAWNDFRDALETRFNDLNRKR